jgi:hypothetical protein
LTGEHGHAFAGIDLQGCNQLAVDFVKNGRASVRQSVISSSTDQWTSMLQAHPAQRSRRMFELGLLSLMPFSTATICHK